MSKQISFRNFADTISSFIKNVATQARTWTFPDKDGTVAMLDDVSIVATLAEAQAGTNDTHFMSPLKNKYVNQRVYNVEAYGAVHDYQVVYSGGSINSSSQTLTIGSGLFTPSDIGKKIRVCGAGAAGVDLITTIANYLSATQVSLTISASTTISNNKVEWGTDDTVAIQNAINAAFTAGGGTVFMPIGNYFIMGALITSLDSVNPNCQLYIPLSNASVRGIKILGESAISFLGGPFAANSNTNITSTPGVNLISSIDGSGTLPSVFSSSYYFDGFVNGNLTYTIFENINIRVKSISGTTHISPSMSAFKTNYIQWKRFKNCQAATESVGVDSAQPTSETYGFYLSDRTHNDDESYYDIIVAQGFYYGFRISEHDRWNKISAWCCYSAMAISSTTLSHAVFGGGQLLSLWCKYGVTFLSSLSSISFDFTAEHWPGSGTSKWYNNIADFYAPSPVTVISGYIRGFCTNAYGSAANISISGTIYGSLHIVDLRIQADISSLNIVSNYNFEASGSDNGGGGNTLTAIGSPTYSTGKVGNCVALNGSTQYLEKSSDVGLTFTDGSNELPGSVCGWIYLNSSSSQIIVNRRDNASTLCEWQLSINASSQLQFTLFSGGGTSNFMSISSSSALSGSTWYHFVVTYDGSKSLTGLKMYINGVPTKWILNMTGTYVSMTAGATHITVGAAAWDHSLKLNGSIDELQFWARILTPNEIWKIYNNGNGISYPY